MILIAIACAQAASAAGQESWQFEKLHLADKSVLEGLLLDEREQSVEFAVIMRPPGRPMQAVIAPVLKSRISRVERLPKKQQDLLRRRFEQFRNRARIEADRMEELQLRQGPSPLFPVDAWQYRGNWFELVTTLDERAARRCIVRVEQIFRAYRHLLPPRRRPQQPLQIVLAGSSAEYRRLLEMHQLSTVSPALYLPATNRILASTDLLSLAQEMAAASQRHEALREQHQRQLDDFATQFAAQAAKLRAKGYQSAEIAAEKRAREAALQREIRALEARIVAAERRNDASFARHSHRAFGRLYHEAFHAYLQNYVLQDAARSVPRWLNEGLAQIFEHGQLDGDYLRIDAPSPELVQLLKGDFERGRPLPLRVVVAAKASDFHGRTDMQTAQRLYSYSWGLAYYLLFGRGLQLEPMLEKLQAGGDDAVQQLERLVGTPLPQLETQWHAFQAW